MPRTSVFIEALPSNHTPGRRKQTPRRDTKPRSRQSTIPKHRCALGQIVNRRHLQWPRQETPDGKYHVQEVKTMAGHVTVLVVLLSLVLCAGGKKKKMPLHLGWHGSGTQSQSRE